MLRPALVVSAFAAVGLVVNILLQISLAYLFGAGADIDAYLAAVTLPTFVNSVLLASLNYAFIPALVDLRVRGQAETAWRLGSSMLWLVCLTLAIISVIGVVFAEPLLTLTVPGFPAAKLALAVTLARITWPTAVFTGATVLLTGIYQSQGRFSRPSLAPVLGSAITLGGVWLLSNRLGIQAVVLSALIGGLAQVCLLMPIMLRSARLSLKVDLGSPYLRRALSLALPLIIGGLFYRAAPVLERYVTSMLPTGSIAHIDYATKIIASLLAISMGGLSATIFPALAETADQPDLARLRATISQGLRTVWALLIPIAVIGGVMRSEVVEVVFQRGNFTSVDTNEVASVLPWFLVAMLGMGIGTVIGPSFYAMKDTLTPAVLGVIEVVVYAVYLPIAGHAFGITGVAAASAVYWDSGLVVFVAVLWRRLGYGGSTIARSMLRSASAAVLSGAVTALISAGVGGDALLTVVLGGGGGLLVYVLTMHRLGANEHLPAKELLFKLFGGASVESTDARSS